MAAGAPKYAEGNINGNLNDIDIGLARLVVNISQTGRGSRIHAYIHDAPRDVGACLLACAHAYYSYMVVFSVAFCAV